MKKLLLLFVIFFQSYIDSSEHSLVFVHIGDTIPTCALTTLKQARFMNESCDIYLLTNTKSIKSINEDLAQDQISVIDVDKIPISQEHLDFIAENGLSTTLNGFWKYTTERFFVIYDFLSHTQLQNVVHLENDTMLYVDLNEIIPQFKQLGVQLAAPFQSLYCCVPCFVYIQKADALKPLVDHILVETNGDNKCDMLTLASFYREQGEEQMFPLSILMSDYLQYYKKRTSTFAPDNETPLEFLTKNMWAFPKYIFDAAAFGVYTNGNDKRYNPYTGPAQVHNRSLCDPGHFNYYWGEDARGRPCPYLSFKGRDYRIVNLHFHSKEPERYTSYSDNRSDFPQPARCWLEDEYLPQISGKMLFIGVGSYTQEYHLLTQTPELFETVDLDETKSQFGSPFGHYTVDFLELGPNREYDHCCLFGILGHPPATSTSIYTLCNDDSIEKGIRHAHGMIKVGGTLLLGPNYKDVPGQDAAFWLQKFKMPPLDRYEVILSTRGTDNMIWWGIKIEE